MRIIVLEPARRDLKDIYDYIAARNPKSATRVMARIRAATARIGDIPRIGRTGLIEGTREWLVSGLPYLIVYKIDEHDRSVIVLAVFHTARQR